MRNSVFRAASLAFAMLQYVGCNEQDVSIPEECLFSDTFGCHEESEVECIAECSGDGGYIGMGFSANFKIYNCVEAIRLYAGADPKDNIFEFCWERCSSVFDNKRPSFDDIRDESEFIAFNDPYAASKLMDCPGDSKPVGVYLHALACGACAKLLLYPDEVYKYSGGPGIPPYVDSWFNPRREDGGAGESPEEPETGESNVPPDAGTN